MKTFLEFIKEEGEGGGVPSNAIGEPPSQIGGLDLGFPNKKTKKELKRWNNLIGLIRRKKLTK